MAVLDIVRLGHPALRTPAEPVDPRELAGEPMQRLFDDLADTLRAAGGVGLAAPQVGVGRQIFLWERQGETRSRDAEEPAEIGFVANPMLSPHAGELVYDWEGCLSIPDLRGLVPRHAALRLQGLGRDGAPIDFELAGFEARIVQHEYDHLNGVVFLDRMRDLRSLAFLEEWERFIVNGA